MDSLVRDGLGMSRNTPLVWRATDPAPASVPLALDRNPLAAYTRTADPLFDGVVSGVWRSKAAPGVALLRADALLAQHGRVEQVGEMFALDGRGEPAMAQWIDPQGEHVLVTFRGEIEVFDLPAAGAELGARPPPLPKLSRPIPSVGALTEPGDLPGALATLAAALSEADTPAMAAAAIGIVGRFARDPSRATAWAVELSDTDRETLARDVVRQASALWTHLEALSAAAAQRTDGRGDLVELVELRDLLASAAWVVEASRAFAGAGHEVMQDALRAVDREVQARWMELPERPAELEELCAEVAWREPTAWWGELP